MSRKFQIDPKKERLLFKILPYPIIFMIGGSLYIFIETGLLGPSVVYPITGVLYDPINSALTVIPMTGILGLALGLIEELVFKNRFKHLRFSYKIVIKTLLYLSIFVIIQFAFALGLNMINMEKSSMDVEVFQSVYRYFASFSIISITIYAGFFINISLFFTEIVDYLGLDIVGNFFSGKYSKPVFENRIFMFLDMKDSTTIAEKIGHKQQHQLISEYYGDMSDAIVLTKGSIYQYVGDEIVVSWKLSEGLKDCNSLHCFFLIEKHITEKAHEYESKYGVVPKFKAGYHCGEVTRGQVGNIKRDLLYIGDVLNATARIQGLCNQLDSSLLISSELKNQLPVNDYLFNPKGEFELRGRNKHEELFEVRSRTNNG